MILSVAAVTVALSGLGATIADAASGGTDPLTYLTGLGFPGIIIALLLTGQLRTKTEVERLIAENESKDAIITSKDRQIAVIQDGLVKDVIPALTKSTQILESMSSDNSLISQLAHAHQEIVALTQRLDDRRGRP